MLQLAVVVTALVSKLQQHQIKHGSMKAAPAATVLLKRVFSSLLALIADAQ
jgi:hypothetical protein